MFIVVSVITMCLIFNVGTILFLLQGMGILSDANLFPEEARLIGALIFLGIVSGYYLVNGRYKKIYSRFKAKENRPPKTWYSILIVVSYYLLSFSLLLLTALYKNRDWIFALRSE
jgi:hypothetical protein